MLFGLLAVHTTHYSGCSHDSDAPKCAKEYDIKMVETENKKKRDLKKNVITDEDFCSCGMLFTLYKVKSRGGKIAD